MHCSAGFSVVSEQTIENIIENLCEALSERDTFVVIRKDILLRILRRISPEALTELTSSLLLKCPEIESPQFAKWALFARKAARLTQGEVGAKCAISQDAISRFETGNLEFGKSRRRRLKAALESAVEQRKISTGSGDAD